MDRSRKPSAQTLAIGSLLASCVIVAFFAGSASTTTGCSSVETVPAPDAALPPCNRGPFTFFCQAPTPGEPSCNTDSSNSPVLARLPQNTAYPVGCVVNFVGPRDEQGDCRLEAVCKCVIGNLPTATPEAGAPVDVDAGDTGDAGDAGDEAGAQPPAPPANPGPTTGPIWLCDG
jgi:hypothetical protein